MPDKKSSVPNIHILGAIECTLCLKEKQPSPSKYPLMKCFNNESGTWLSVGNFSINDLLGIHPNSINLS